jgi:hypothetical protein
MDLFEKKNFISHAGIPMTWKLECDAISESEWEALARMIMDYETRPFGSVEGIPRGGIPLANALREYATEGPPMIVDDVYTTGASFKEYCNEHYRTVSFDYNPKWVIFARTKPADRSGIKALFTMPGI